jgi:hypothetical protein
MYVPFRISTACLVLSALASPSTASAEELARSRQETKISQIGQIVAYSTEYSEEDQHAGPYGGPSADLCGYFEESCRDVVVDLPMPPEGANEAVVWQGMLGSPCTDCIVDLLQYGSDNSIRIEQDGTGNAVSAFQDGDSNELLGLQSGAHNFIGISQYHSENFADISQYGDGHRIAVTQPGNGFIVITQE